MKTFFTFFLAALCLAANAQTFTNNTVAGQNSWNNTLTRTVNVIGLPATLSPTLELVQVNLSLGAANGNAYDLSKYNITLTSPTGVLFNIAPTNSLAVPTLVPPAAILPKRVNIKYRSDNSVLQYPNQNGGAYNASHAVGEPWDVGYFKIKTGETFSTANNTNPNGAWTLTINETATTQGMRFNKVDLVFGAPIIVNDVRNISTYDECSAAVCLETGKVVLATNAAPVNNNGNAQTDPYLYLGTGCQWNGALHNTTWYKFKANAATAKLTVSGIMDRQEAIVIEAVGAPCGTSGTVAGGGNSTDWSAIGSPCATTNNTYTSSEYNNPTPGSLTNLGFNLTNLTVGNTYYLVLDGTGQAVSNYYIEIDNALSCCPTVATITQQNPSCVPGNDGSLTANGSVGVAPYTYLWNNSVATATISGLTTGTYTVTVTDANGCSKTATAALTTPLLPATTTTANGGAGPITVCAGATINMQTLGSLPAGASVDWYSSTTAGSTPPTNSVLLGNTNATGCSAICPQMMAIFINACDGAANDEPLNEYMIFSSGGGFNANDFQLEYSNPTAGDNANVNLGVSPCTIQTPTASLIASLQVGLCTPANLIPVAPGSFVPSGATVVFFTSNGVTSSYNFQPLCGAGQTIYVMQSGCTRTSGAFGNGVLPCAPVAGAIRTTTISLANCPTCVDSLAYSRCGIGNTDGEYAIKLPNNVVSSVANGGILIDATNPCNGPNLSALPVPADTLRFSFATTAANCNTTRYIKGVVNPNTAGCPNYTQEFVLNVVCPAATITKVDATCNIANGSATADPGTTLPVTYLWDNGATTATISNLAAGTYTVTVTAVGAACASTASVVIIQNTIPTLTATATNQCNGGTISLSALPSSGGAGGFLWLGPNSFNQNIQNPTIANANNGLHNGTYTVTATFAGGCTRTATVSVNVLNQLNGQITGTSGSVCVGSIISLSATGGNNYAWAGPNGFSYPNTQSPPALNNVTVAMSGVYTVTVTGSNSCSSISTRQITVSPCSSCNDNGCKGPNLVQNTDFSNNFTGFTSQYLPNNGNATCTPGANCNGQFICQYGYAITNTAPPCNPGWSANIQDHTPTGNGNFMIVDFPTGIQSNILCTNVVLGANKTYCVGGYFINLLPIGSTSTDPKFQFSIDGVIDPSTFTVDNDEQWQFKGVSYTTGATVPATVQICIRNENFGAIGFDVALDDISVREDLSGSAPTAVADAIALCNSAASVTYSVVGNDTGGFDPTTLSISTQAPFSLGSAVANTNGTVTFTPTAAFTSGNTDFDYRICNTAGTCCANATVTVSIASPTVSITAPAAICLGESPILTAVPVNATAPTYAWSTGGTTTSITPSPAPTASTTYTVTVTANGCTATATRTITVNQVNGVASKNSDASCSLANGVATAVAFPAAGATFLWDNGVTTANNNTLTAGTHTVTITVANGCTVTRTVVIADTPAPVINIAQVNTNCGVNIGTANASVTVGTATYTWSNGQTGSGITGLAAGIYTVTATNAPNCTSSATVTITNQNAPVLTPSQTNATCGLANGTATVNFALGIGATYVWSTTPPQNTATATGLAAGVYTVTATTNLGGCIVTQNFTITNTGTAPTLTATATDITCTTAAGTATATVAGGTTVVWSFNNANTLIINNLTAGNYTVTATNAAGCTAVSTATVANTAVLPTIGFTNAVPTICGQANGSILANSSVLNSTFLWNSMPQQNTAALTNVPPGTYIVTVTTPAGCSSTTSVTLMNTQLNLGVTLVGTNPGCMMSDGSIATTVTGLNGATPTYTWSPALPNTANPTNLPGATYTVTVSVGNGCTATASVFLQGCFAIFGTPTPTTCGLNNGQATVSTIATVFLWSNGETTQTITNLAAGSYTVTATIGTLSSSTVVVVAPSTAGFTTATTPQITMCGLDNGRAVVIVTPNVILPNPATYSYLWSDGQASELAINLAPNTYTVTVTDDFTGCTQTNSVIVAPSTAPPLLTANVNPTTCGLINGSANINFPAGANVDWSNGEMTPIIENLAAGTYTVTVALNNCTQTASVVVATSTNTAAVNIADNPVIYAGQSVTINANGNSAGTYSWSNAATTNPITVTPSANTTYTVVFTNTNGCTATDQVQVVVNKLAYDIPNFFTPNDDGTNDYFKVVSDANIEVTNIKIYNRWGELVFDKPYSKWDGTFNATPQPMDTYVYVVTILLPDGKEVTKVGDLFLIR